MYLLHFCSLPQEAHSDSNPPASPILPQATGKRYLEKFSVRSSSSLNLAQACKASPGTAIRELHVLVHGYLQGQREVQAVLVKVCQFSYSLNTEANVKNNKKSKMY